MYKRVHTHLGPRVAGPFCTSNRHLFQKQRISWPCPSGFLFSLPVGFSSFLARSPGISTRLSCQRTDPGKHNSNTDRRGADHPMSSFNRTYAKQHKHFYMGLRQTTSAREELFDSVRRVERCLTSQRHRSTATAALSDTRDLRR
jgi:hypothetical protein